jgi:hypothetical protein
MRFKFQNLIIVPLLFLISSCTKLTTTPSIDSKFDEFKINWSLYKKSSSGGWKNNFYGRFSWDDAYALEGLYYNYFRSSDIRYLDTFILVAKNIFLNSDLQFGIRDKYRNNKIIHGWSSKRYTIDSSYHVFGVTNAMILYPIIKMYNLSYNVLPKNDFRLDFFEYAIQFAKDEFEEVQITDYKKVNDSLGYFHDPYYKYTAIETPVNQFARVASYALELYIATKNKVYLDYVTGVAKFIRNNLIDTLNYQYWFYFPGTQVSNNSYEDLGHSILTIQFLILCYENKIVFNDYNINKLVNLFKNQTFSSSNLSFREYLVGNEFSKDPIFSYYFMLSKYDFSIHKSLSKWIDLNPVVLDNSTFLNHFGNKLILNSALRNYFTP